MLNRGIAPSPTCVYFATDPVKDELNLILTMLDFVEMEAAHVVGIRVDRSIVASDIERAMKALEEKLQTNDRVSFFVEIDDLSGVSPEAIFKDIRFGLEQLKNLGRFYRSAVVTDIKWIRAAAGVEDLLIPRVEVKAFEKADRDVALAWISRVPAL